MSDAAKKLGAERTVPWERTPGSLAEGLTKREWFAAVALQGVVSFRGAETSDVNARLAVAHADALLAELAKERP